MSVSIECPCGHIVRIPDGLNHDRIKCTVCGELLRASDAHSEMPTDSEKPTDSEVPTEEVPEPAAAGHSETPQPVAPAGRAKPKARPKPQPHNNRTTHFQGHTGCRFAGLLMPSFFGEASLTLLPDRVRLKSTGIFSTRRADLLLSDITSGETRRAPGWYLLPFGFLLLPANGVGLILLIAFLFVRHSFVVVTCGTTNALVRFKGDDSDACAVVDAILQAATDKEK